MRWLLVSALLCFGGATGLCQAQNPEPAKDAVVSSEPSKDAVVSSEPAKEAQPAAGAAAAPAAAAQPTTQLIKEFYVDKIQDTNYFYSFPEKTSAVQVDGANPGVLDFVLDKKVYSGGFVGNYPSTDMTDVRYGGVLEFSIKGDAGLEPVKVIIVDSQDKDGIKCQVQASSLPFTVRPYWQKVALPLSLFPSEGSYWDGSKMVKAPFDWSDVLEVQFLTPPTGETAPSFNMKQQKGESYKFFVKDVRVVSAPRRQMKAISELKFKKGDIIAADAAGADPLVGCYHGIFRQDLPPDMGRLDSYEELAGKKVALVTWYVDWSESFPENDCKKIYDAGALAVVTWEPWYWDKRGTIYLKEINDGKFDSYIRHWAKGAKKWKKPVFIRLAHEFNGNWYPWGIAKNGEDPKVFAEFFRHVVKIFRDEKVTNVQWVWTPYCEPIPKTSWNDCVRAYPGDEYVDWVGYSLYNFGNSRPGAKWREFAEMAEPLYTAFQQAFPSKPLMLPEVSCAEGGGDKAKWIEAMGRDLKEKFPRVLALCWFDIMKETDWRMDSSIGSVVAYQGVVRDPFFKVNRDNLWKVPEQLKAKVGGGKAS